MQGITDVSECIVVNATDPGRLRLIQSQRRDYLSRRSLTPPPSARPEPSPPPADEQGQQRLAYLLDQ